MTLKTPWADPYQQKNACGLQNTHPIPSLAKCFLVQNLTFLPVSDFATYTMQSYETDLDDYAQDFVAIGIDFGTT